MSSPPERIASSFSPSTALTAMGTCWAFSARRVAVTVMAIPLLFVCLDLAAYYYVCLILFVLVHRDDPAKLALLFAAETVVYVLRVFEERDAVLYLYRNVVVAWVIFAMFRDEIRAELAAGYASFRRNTVSR